MGSERPSIRRNGMGSSRGDALASPSAEVRVRVAVPDCRLPPFLKIRSSLDFAFSTPGETPRFNLLVVRLRGTPIMFSALQGVLSHCLPGELKISGLANA